MLVWRDLPKGFCVLAPMEDVTDRVFRAVIEETAPPEVFFTEFTNVDGLFSAGREVVEQRLEFLPGKVPLVAQIWGKKPELFELAARKLAAVGFSGIDINLGCPDGSVMKNGCGAALIGQNKLVAEIIEATKAGAGGLPVSVKTRFGIKTPQTESWIGFLLSCELQALTVHARTAAAKSEVPADWQEIASIVKLRDEIAPPTIIIGNGDVPNRQEAEIKSRETGVDGVMIGRGIFRNPWAFSRGPQSHSFTELLYLLLKHLNMFEAVWGRRKNFSIMKKFFKMYVTDFPGAGELRSSLMLCGSPSEVRELVTGYLQNI